MSNMKYLLVSFLSISLLFGKCISCFTKNDVDVTFSLVRNLEISSCVFVKRSCDKISQVLNISKKISNNNFYFLYFHLRDFLNYFSKGKIPERRTMIILKADDNADAFGITQELTQKISMKKHCSHFVWIMILPANMKKLTEKNLEIPFNCEFIIAQEHNSGFELTEIFQVKDYTELIYAKLGFWDQTNGINVAIEKYISGRRKKYLSGTEMILRAQPKEADVLRKGFLLLWSGIQDSFNFTTLFMTGKDLRKKHKKAKFDVEDIYKPFHSMTPQTKDLIGPAYYVKNSLFIRLEKDNEQYWGSYLRPLGFDVWMTLSAWLLFSTILITITAKLRKSSLSLTDFAILDHAFTPFTAITYQGCFEKLSKISYRIELLAILTVSTVIVPAYSAVIISYLTVTKPIIPFNSLETFVKDGTYKLTTIKHPMLSFTFTLINDPVFMIIKRNHLLPLNEFPSDPLSLVQTLCWREKIAIFDNGFNFQKVRSPCVIVRAAKSVMTMSFGLELQAYSPFKKMFNEIWLKVRTSGMLDDMIKTGQYKDMDIDTEEPEPIDLQMTSSIFIIIIVAVIFAMLIFITEIGWNHVKVCKENNRPIIKKKISIAEKSRLRFYKLKTYVISKLWKE